MDTNFSNDMFNKLTNVRIVETDSRKYRILERKTHDSAKSYRKNVDIHGELFNPIVSDKRLNSVRDYVGFMESLIDTKVLKEIKVYDYALKKELVFNSSFDKRSRLFDLSKVVMNSVHRKFEVDFVSNNEMFNSYAFMRFRPLNGKSVGYYFSVPNQHKELCDVVCDSDFAFINAVWDFPSDPDYFPDNYKLSNGIFV
ncbi:hypothetical protein K9L67_05105 [Candidatus Woesearchaeota archaeon]|nr:hypothetical protein [Candidatus Woesearchaeota archaeon]MCF7901576.1 hypothetical protein [Candidatus Woesearchaeota archaeon]MCF8013980.1 hypothetical protein [Candidatus Woesearchaeota archaeon]